MSNGCKFLSSNRCPGYIRIIAFCGLRNNSGGTMRFRRTGHHSPWHPEVKSPQRRRRSSSRLIEQKLCIVEAFGGLWSQLRAVRSMWWSSWSCYARAFDGELLLLLSMQLKVRGALWFGIETRGTEEASKEGGGGQGGSLSLTWAWI